MTMAGTAGMCDGTLRGLCAACTHIFITLNFCIYFVVVVWHNGRSSM